MPAWLACAAALFFALAGAPAHGRQVPTASAGRPASLGEFALREQAKERHAALEREAYVASVGLRLAEGDESGSYGALLRLEAGFPVFVQTLTNLSAANEASAGRLWPEGDAGFALDGTGAIVGIWDAGAVRASHREFGDGDAVGDSRVDQRDGAGFLLGHSTAVAGGIAAFGVEPEARGIAPGVQLWTHDWYGDTGEMAAAASKGLLVSNHSYGEVNGWGPSLTISGVRLPAWYGDESVDRDEDYRFGYYSSDARLWDELLFLAPNLLSVKAAGNDRGVSQPAGTEHWVFDKSGSRWTRSTATRQPDGGDDGFDSVIGDAAVAKNVLTVGAASTEAGVYAGPKSVASKSNSGWGPSDDGRIKPDLVAPGVGGFSSAASADDAYMTYQGTSMAAAVTSGVLGLLLQQRASLGKPALKAATWKALLVHSATETGPAAGPDYMFGWGMLNAHEANRLLAEDGLAGGGLYLREGTLGSEEVASFEVVSEGGAPLKVTMAWTDPPGEVGQARKDSRKKALVNDLDLRIVGPGGPFEPWVLDPDRPAQAAGRGDNSRDNVEQVVVPQPAPGTYEVRVSHKAKLSGPEQAFSLVLSGIPNPAARLDHDGDGIQTRYEDVDGDGDLFDDDTDRDGLSNYVDSDDDGDGTPTADELGGSLVDGRPVNPPDTDLNGLPDYLDPVQLPIELAAFEAIVDGGDVVLRWTTESELDNAGFEVQHATWYDHPVLLFESLDFVEGRGSTTAPEEYSYRVRRLDVGYHVFRLKQVDLDGRFSYSPELEVVLDWPGFAEPVLFPNPATHLAWLEYGSRSEESVRVSLVDALGRTVQLLADSATRVDQRVRLPLFLDRLATGTYYVRLASELREPIHLPLVVLGH